MKVTSTLSLCCYPVRMCGPGLVATSTIVYICVPKTLFSLQRKSCCRIHQNSAKDESYSTRMKEKCFPLLYIPLLWGTSSRTGAQRYQIQTTLLFTIVYQRHQKAKVIRNRFVASSYHSYNWRRETIQKCQNIIKDILGEVSEVLSKKNKALEQKYLLRIKSVQCWQIFSHQEARSKLCPDTGIIN